VILIARRNIWTWPVGIIGVLLFGALFYQINLYADALEQVYYLITGIIGWYMWARLKNRGDKDKKATVTTNTVRSNLTWTGAIAIASLTVTWALLNIHLWLPNLFPVPADLPGLDATTTIMSFAAQLLMMRRRLESWILWIIVDIIAIGLYWYKDVPFVALLYVIFLINAIYGFMAWRKAMREPKEGK
jgi:nicotinamide mononucleotide transporter